MELSKEQLTFVDKINLPLDSDERVKDINTFFLYCCEIKEKLKSCRAILNGYMPPSIRVDSPDFYKVGNKDINARICLENKSIIFIDRDETIYKVISFIELWKYLEKEKLISVIKKNPNDMKYFLVPVLNDTVKAGIRDIHPIDNKLWQIVKDYVLLEIVPLPNLKEFINRRSKNMGSKINKAKAIELLNEKIKQYEEIIKKAKYENRYDSKYESISLETELLIEKLFDEDEVKRYKGIGKVKAKFIGMPIDKAKELFAYKKILNERIAKLNAYKNTIKNTWSDNDEKSSKVKANENINKKNMLSKNSSKDKIFIVHGQNEEMKQSVARVLEKQDFDVIILHEQPNKGKTIIEKFENYSNVKAALILLSGDDYGYSKNKSNKDKKLRPRQNVIFEMGYFIGKLKRENVISLLETDVDIDILSDYKGVIYLEYDVKGSWKYEMCKELKGIGFEVDLNKV